MDPERDQEKAPSKNEPVFSKRIESAPLLEKNHFEKHPAHRDDKGNYLKWGGIVALGIIALITIIILGGRAVTGYNTYSDMQASGVPKEYASNMAALAAAKAAAEAETEAARAEQAAAQERATTELAKIAQERESHAATKATLESDLERSRTTSNALQEEVQVLEPAFQDAARKLCCVQRAINPAITGYDITEENTVVCVSDNSGTRISC